MLTGKLEIMSFDSEGEWYKVQVAVDGVPAVPFEFLKSVRDSMRSEEEFLNYLYRQGVTLREQFGDARRQPSEC